MFAHHGISAVCTGIVLLSRGAIEALGEGYSKTATGAERLLSSVLIFLDTKTGSTHGENEFSNLRISSCRPLTLRSRSSDLSPSLRMMSHVLLLASSCVLLLAFSV